MVGEIGHGEHPRARRRCCSPAVIIALIFSAALAVRRWSPADRARAGVGGRDPADGARAAADRRRSRDLRRALRDRRLRLAPRLLGGLRLGADGCPRDHAVPVPRADVRRRRALAARRCRSRSPCCRGGVRAAARLDDRRPRAHRAARQREPRGAGARRGRGRRRAGARAHRPRHARRRRALARGRDRAGGRRAVCRRRRIPPSRPRPSPRSRRPRASALADVRLLLAQLRHSQGDGPQPTLADLEALYAQVRAAGVDLRVDVDPAPPAEPPGGRAARGVPDPAGGADQRPAPRRRRPGRGAPRVASRPRRRSRCATASRPGRPRHAHARAGARDASACASARSSRGGVPDGEPAEDGCLRRARRRCRSGVSRERQ